MNRNNKLFMGAAVLLLVAVVGVAWAATPPFNYNRPKPLMDYAPQEIGIGDYLYPSLGQDDCRLCHGTSLADRHHYSELCLSQGMCTPCHEITTTPPYVDVVRDCTTVGCHSGSDLGPLDVSGLPPNGWHHYTFESWTDQCLACHEPDILDRVVDDEYVPFEMYPPTVVTPTPYSCENCHWEQPVIANTVGFVNGAPQGGNPYYTGGTFPDLTDAGHPSTFDHSGPYNPYAMQGDTAGNWNDYYEYGKKIESNYDTHHMLFNGNVSTDCVRCHTQDPAYPAFDPLDPELIRGCETCHDVATLHAIEPHVGPGASGTADPPAVNGWEAVGFHLPDTSNTDTTDFAPSAYSNNTANEQCFGCHADQLPTWLPDPPVAQPIITSIVPQLTACDGYITLTGNHFGDIKTSLRNVQIKPTAIGGVWTEVPIVSWISTQIEFQIPCWIYATGNYKVVVDTEQGPPSNQVPMIIASGATMNALSPASGLCREVITVTGSNFDVSQDGLVGGSNYGVYKVVQVVSSAGIYQATVYGGWSPTSFQFRMGDLFKDDDPSTSVPQPTDQDFIRNGPEQLLRQCEAFSLGTYSIYVRTIYYEDIGGTAGSYDAGDLIHQITISDPEYFTLEDGMAVYLILPGSAERSHYCEIMGDAIGNEDTICDPTEPCYIQNSVAKIYGFGFGPSQGNGHVYIGNGLMYLADTGKELNRNVWSSLMIKAAIDVPTGVKGMQLYIWVEKDGVKTDASYGYPGMFILNQETCN